MTQTAYIRDDQADIRVTVNGASYGDGNSWATYEGAVLEAAGAKTRAGGMGKEYAIGGFASRGDTTITIQNSDSMVGQHKALEKLIGRGDVVITVTWLDDYGNVRPSEHFSVTGKLKSAGLPGQNFDSASAGMYTIVMDSDQEANG
jgi:hypothetical protein